MARQQCLGQGENLIAVLGDQDGVLKLRCQGSVGGHSRPVVLPVLLLQGVEVERGKMSYEVM